MPTECPLRDSGRGITAEPEPFRLAASAVALALLVLTIPAGPALAAADDMVLTAHYAVSIAEEAHFAVTGTYTDSYEELVRRGGLVTNPSVCYGTIQLYTVTGTGASGLRFAVGHADRETFRGAYAFDSAAPGDTVARIVNVFDCRLFGGEWKPGPTPRTRDTPGVVEADAAVQAAFRAVAAAQEAHFAEKGSYSENFGELRGLAGLAADPTVCYGPIQTYLLSDGTAGFRFRTGHAGRDGLPVAYSYDSHAPWGNVARAPNNFACSDFGGGRRGDAPAARTGPDRADADKLVQAAYRSVATAQEAFFAQWGTYATGYADLKEKGGLVTSPSVCYGPMETNMDGPAILGFRFRVGHASRDAFPGAYVYDSTAAGDNKASRTPNTFDCILFGNAQNR
ncbi:MAG: hypothetical protein LBQ79_02190 [Deltaproteobacteria bacterium]|jgi:hypothetical protein|nr:hypothetical protein [Deltaproteobacteria bacterium]